MMMVEVKLQNGIGMHARPASQIVSLANKYVSTIFIEYDGKKINAKSMMGVLSSGIKSDVNFMLSCEGEDEGVALAELASLFANIKE